MKVNKRQTKEVVRKRHMLIAQDYNDGMLVKDIAEKHDVSVPTIYYALKRVENYNDKEENK